MGTFQTASAAGPNYYTNKEYVELVYKGYIQFKPSYYDHQYGGNVYNSYIRYTDGHGRDTGRLYAGPGKSRNDSKIYSRSATFRDKICWSCAKSRFYFGFNVAPKNSWPRSNEGDYPVSDEWTIENTFEVGGHEDLD